MIRVTEGARMMSSMMLVMGLLLAATLVVNAGVASAADASREKGEAKQFQAVPTRTGKERLGGKASDDQRVDNCKVPSDLRGPKPRPDECRDGAAQGSER